METFLQAAADALGRGGRQSCKVLLPHWPAKQVPDLLLIKLSYPVEAVFFTDLTQEWTGHSEQWLLHSSGS